MAKRRHRSTRENRLRSIEQNLGCLMLMVMPIVWVVSGVWGLVFPVQPVHLVGQPPPLALVPPERFVYQDENIVLTTERIGLAGHYIRLDSIQGLYVQHHGRRWGWFCLGLPTYVAFAGLALLGAVQLLMPPVARDQGSILLGVAAAGMGLAVAMLAKWAHPPHESLELTAEGQTFALRVRDGQRVAAEVLPAWRAAIGLGHATS